MSTTATTPTGIGIIGCGAMGQVHAGAFAREPHARLVAFQNRSRDKAAALAAPHGARVHDSVDALLADPAVHAVVIASSQQVHSQQIIAAARAGKAILAEKPLALTRAELDDIGAVLADTGVPLVVGHQLREHPILHWVRAQAAQLGPIYHLDLEMAFRISGAGGRCWTDIRSGGFFMELGVHLADLATWFMGPPRHVHANTLRLNPERVTEDFTHCLIQHAGARSSAILVSANHRTERQGLLIGRLLGAHGRIDFRVYPYGRECNSASLTLDHGCETFVPDTTVIPCAIALPESLSSTFPGFFDVYQRQAHAFLAHIRDGAPAVVDFTAGRAAVEIVLAAYASQGQATAAPNLTHGLDLDAQTPACHPVLDPT